MKMANLDQLAKYLSKTFKHVEVFYYDDIDAARDKYYELTSAGCYTWLTKSDYEAPLLLRTCTTHKIQSYLSMGLVAAIVVVLQK